MLDDTFTPHGKHLIAGDWATGAGTFRSDPASGPAHDFAIGTPELVDRACEAAEDAFWSYGWTSRADRAAFLNAIADEIEARGPAITAIGSAETGLPEARLAREAELCYVNVAMVTDLFACAVLLVYFAAELLS